MNNIVKTSADIQDKSVKVNLSGGHHLTGIVLGEDKDKNLGFRSIYVGVTKSSFTDIKLQPGQKYLSVFRAKSQPLKY